VTASTTLILCLWGISERSAWRDEQATWWAASLSFQDLYRLTRHVDVVLAPYYVFMHLWISVFGDSLTALRLPSALAMAGAGGLVGLLGRRVIGSTQGGLIAGLFFALVPTVTRYGQEARPYALAMLTVLLASLALLRALERPGSRRWVAYAMTVPLMGWSHLVALTVLAAHLAMVTRARRQEGRRPMRAWAAAAGGGLLPVVPLVVLGSAQSQQIAWNTPAWNDAAAMPYMLFRSPVMTAAVLGCAAVAFAKARRWQDSGPGPRTHLIPLALWALVPFLLTAATARWLHLFLDRYLLFTVPAWILLATMGLHRAKARPAVARVVAAALVVVVTAFAPLDRAYLTHNTPHEPDYHAVAGAVLAGQRPSDGIAYASRLMARRALDYELRDGPRPKDVFLYETPQELGSYEAVECPDPRSCAAGYQRIWLVSAGSGTDPFGGMPKAESSLLRTDFRTVRTEHFPNAELLLLERVP
jgi:mannosyltransferase